MQYKLTTFFLEFKTPFKIAHGTRNGTDLVFLEIVQNGIVAHGEASLPPYLPETTETVQTFIGAFFKQHSLDLTNISNSLQQLHNFQPGNFAAKACVDIALHNWFAKKDGVEVWQLLGLKNGPLPPCTFTIGMGDKESLQQKVIDGNDFSILKVKLGGENDKQIISTIREVTNKPLCVDVNQGWKDKMFALDMIHWLHDQNIIFVEQPLPKNNFDDSLWLHELSPLPLIADEAVQIPSDVVKIKDSFDGVNMKLMKCGGISEGLKLIREARKYHLKVLIGSMSESGCAISAAAQLSSLADWTDLDGPLLTKNNPFDVINYKDGRVVVM
ncbi:MAG TPA: dipeptide epimerase [Bacteroidia bacterium]|nr:dipeptide epimerase [Bacteroidia bacterium]